MSTLYFLYSNIWKLFLIFLILFRQNFFITYLLAYVYTYTHSIIDSTSHERYVSIDTCISTETRFRARKNKMADRAKTSSCLQYTKVYCITVIRHPIKIYTYIHRGIATISEVSICGNRFRGRTRVPGDLKDQIERLHFNRAIFARSGTNL